MPIESILFTVATLFTVIVILFYIKGNTVKVSTINYTAIKTSTIIGIISFYSIFIEDPILCQEDVEPNENPNFTDSGHFVNHFDNKY